MEDAMTQYGIPNNKPAGDEILYQRDNWRTAFANCPDVNPSFEKIWAHQDQFYAQPDAQAQIDAQYA